MMLTLAGFNKDGINIQIVRRLSSIIVFAAYAGGLQWPAAAMAADDELATLRAENARLAAELNKLRAQCPASVQATAPVAGVPKAPPANTSNPPSSAAPSSATPPAVAVPAAAADNPVPPPGYKLVPVAPANSETGCRTGGLFGQSPDAPWKSEENWSALRRGMNPTEVEELLGKDHFNVTGNNGRIAWQYGKCGITVQGSVVFENGAVLYFTHPDF